MIDPIVYLDDLRFVEAQFQGGNQLYLVGANGKDAIVFDVSEETFRALRRDPSSESISQILNSHHWEFV